MRKELGFRGTIHSCNTLVSNGRVPSSIVRRNSTAEAGLATVCYVSRALAVWHIYRVRENWQSRLYKNGQSRSLRTGKAGGENGSYTLVSGRETLYYAAWLGV